MRDKQLPRIFKFRKDYASLMGGVRMYLCPICSKPNVTEYSVLGHLFADHHLDFEFGRKLWLAHQKKIC